MLHIVYIHIHVRVRACVCVCVFLKKTHKNSSKAGSISSRKTSTIDFSVQRRFLPRYPMKSARSFEMHRSALRLLGSPIIRSAPSIYINVSFNINGTKSNRRCETTTSYSSLVISNAIV